MASGGLSCTICSDLYEDSTDICSTRCGHIYHMSCLEQWIIRSNSCPMCIQTNPEPHRIYLDIEILNQPTTLNTSLENDRREHTVVIRGIYPKQITTPLYTLIHQLIDAMQVDIVENDIKNISKQENDNNKRNISVLVVFKTTQRKELFLQHKHKLKNKPDISKIRIYELLNEETEALFIYSQKLKKFCYKIIYVEKNKVYVQKERNLQPLNILSKEQVDNLCEQLTNNTEVASPSNIPNKNQNPLTKNSKRSSVQVKNNKETESLFQYCQKLKRFGYNIIFIENNKIFAKRSRKSQRINIISKEQVDNLNDQSTNNSEVVSNLININEMPSTSYSQRSDQPNNYKETQTLFQYCQKLKNFGYKIVFLENNKIFVKKTKKSPRINILSKEQVDNLCVQRENNKEAAAASNNNQVRAVNSPQMRSIKRNYNEELQELHQYSKILKDVGYGEFYVQNNRVFVKKHWNSQPIIILSRDQVDNLRADYFQGASTLNIRNNVNIQPAVDYLRLSDDYLKKKEAQELFQHSQKLKNIFGYEIIFDGNNVYVDKTNDLSFTPINIVSKSQVDSLFIEITSNPQSRPIIPSQYYNAEMEELAEYCKKLARIDYAITYKNNEVWAQNNETRIQIMSKRQVRELLSEHERKKSKCIIS